MENPVSVTVYPEAGVSEISKKALPLVPVDKEPVRAATPKLLVPDAPVYPDDADVVEIKVTAPLLLPLTQVPGVRLALEPDVAVEALLQSHT